jgi:hypothetical protein
MIAVTVGGSPTPLQEAAALHSLSVRGDGMSEVHVTHMKDTTSIDH